MYEYLINHVDISFLNFNFSRQLSLTMWMCQESHNWVMAFYRATGQAHRPAPPVTTGNNKNINKNGDADKARKHGMEEYIAADPITFDHALLFKKLQSFSLDWRLSDPFASLVSSDETKKQSKEAIDLFQNINL